MFRDIGISPGATLPAFLKLKGQGLVREEEGTGGRKTAFGITPAGKKHLEADWRFYLASPTADTETILRAVTLALLLGDERDQQDALLLLADAASARRVFEIDCRANANHLKAENLPPDALHLWMRTEMEANSLMGEAAAFRNIAKYITQRFIPRQGEGPPV